MTTFDQRRHLTGGMAAALVTEQKGTALKEGMFATDGLPPSGKISSGYDWDAMARRARRRPGTPLLAGENVRYSLIKSVKQYRRETFTDDTGRIVVNMRNSRVNDGVRTGDVWFTWVPHEGAEGDQVKTEHDKTGSR